MAVERPLLGEPLGLDLLNTTWIDRGNRRDMLDDLDGTRQWMVEAGLAPAAGDPAGQPAAGEPAGESVRRSLVAAREAIRAHVDDPGSESARVALNEVLSWGRTRPVLGPEGPGTANEMDDPSRRAGWAAAVNYLELLAGDASRIRRCAHPECVLYFYDTSPKRSRRWCSMAGCGNRAKAARHYARSKQS